MQKLAEDFPQVEVVNRSYDGVEAELRDAEVIFTISLRPEQFALCRQLRWIHAPTAGVHPFQFPELISSDVMLTNSTQVHGPVVAEHVIAQIFRVSEENPANCGSPAETCLGTGNGLEQWSTSEGSCGCDSRADRCGQYWAPRCADVP